MTIARKICNLILMYLLSIHMCMTWHWIHAAHVQMMKLYEARACHNIHRKREREKKHTTINYRGKKQQQMIFVTFKLWHRISVGVVCLSKWFSYLSLFKLDFQKKIKAVRRNANFQHGQISQESKWREHLHTAWRRPNIIWLYTQHKFEWFWCKRLQFGRSIDC